MAHRIDVANDRATVEPEIYRLLWHRAQQAIHRYLNRPRPPTTLEELDEVMETIRALHDIDQIPENPSAAPDPIGCRPEE